MVYDIVLYDIMFYFIYCIDMLYDITYILMIMIIYVHC